MYEQYSEKQLEDFLKKEIESEFPGWKPAITFDPQYTYPAGMIVPEYSYVSVIGSPKDADRIVAVFAHELGHLEQRKLNISINEPDAWLRGAKWAARWNVMDEYLEALERFISTGPRAAEEFSRVYRFLQELFEGVREGKYRVIEI